MRWVVWMACCLAVGCVAGVEPETGVNTSLALAATTSAPALPRYIALRAVNGKFVGADPVAPGLLAANALGRADYQTFEVVSRGTDTIALKNVGNNLFVTAEQNGTQPLRANRATAGTWETFRLRQLGDSRIALLATTNNRYVTAESAGNGAIIANRTSVAAWETFDMIDASRVGTAVALRAINGLYVTAQGTSNVLQATAAAPGGNELFDIVPLASGRVALRGRLSGKYVSAESAGAKPLVADRNTPGAWETFSIVNAGIGRIALRAEVNGRFVTAENAGASPLIANRSSVSTWESFYFVNYPDLNQAVEICPGVRATLNGIVSASTQLQQCIDQTASGATLEIPAGRYLMTTAVELRKPMTLRTRGTANSTTACLRPDSPYCATLIADPSLNVQSGFLRLVDGTNHITVEHIVLDGNHAARVHTTSGDWCVSGYNRYGFNAYVRGTYHRWAYNASVRALCGTALEWSGDYGTIVNNFFSDNGEGWDGTLVFLWADGLTVHKSDYGLIANNISNDSSDIGIVVGGGVNLQMYGNQINMTWNRAFGGMMLDNFMLPAMGNFDGAEVYNNVINGGEHRLHFGFNMGPHPWHADHPYIYGAHVHHNTIRNAMMGLNVEGAGIVDHPMVVHDNDVSGSLTHGPFLCGDHWTSNFNIGPDSVVDLRGGAEPETRQQFHDCP